jgi:hypothetical protein
MPQSFNDFINSTPTQPTNSLRNTNQSPSPNQSSSSPQSFNSFMNSNQQNSQPNSNPSTASQSPASAPQSFNDFINSTPTQPSTPSSGGFFSNLLHGAENIVTHPWDNIKSAYTHVQGGLDGAISGMFGRGQYGLPSTSAEDTMVQGFLHPDQAAQTFQSVKDDMANTPIPQAISAGLSGYGLHDDNNVAGKAITNFALDTAHDPLSYLPIGPAAKALGIGAKVASDAIGATPYIAKALNATAKAPGIKQAIGGTQDLLGKMFTPNYGASPALVDALKEGAGNHTANQASIVNALKELAMNNKNTPELDQAGHMVEKTFSGPLTADQNSFLKEYENLRDNGPQAHGSMPIGTNAMAHTASAVTGEPVLQNVRDNYFKHMYDNMTPAQKKMFPNNQQGVPGLSSDGVFNDPRTFQTLQDAMDAGLKPTMDPYQVLGEHLNQSSKALTNNQTIATIKNTPGLLFDKDPIDEVKKLMITGRMTEDQAAAHLGMSLDDMKKGFVQSKVPQLSGAYIRPADEAALVEHLNPSKATGLFGAADKLNNLYNKGFLLNPAPHLHNIYTNGVVLGGAKPSYIKEAYDNISNGLHDPNYMAAMRSGAISNPVGGKFSDVINKAVNPTKNPFTTVKGASHNLLWNNDSAIRTALHRQGMESGMSASDAAAHTNKFMVDYQNLTPFEKQYVKPLVNFYAWKKGNIPLQASQMLAQTPKYAIRGHALDNISQAMSGNPADSKGRVDPNQQLSDGSHTMIDPYDPMGDIGKIADKGILPWLYNSQNPVAKAGEDIGSSLAQVAGLPIQNKFPIFNSSAPLGHNLAAGAAYTANALNPLNSLAVLSGLINGLFGQKTKDVPGETPTELVTNLLGGFTGRVNPAKDAKNAAYAQRDSVVNHIKYEKSVGIPVSKAENRAAYRKIK